MKDIIKTTFTVVAILVTMIAPIVFIWRSICLCFGLEFNWLHGVGIFLIIVLLKIVIGSSRK